jgi:hypothetical protein
MLFDECLTASQTTKAAAMTRGYIEFSRTSESKATNQIASIDWWRSMTSGQATNLESQQDFTETTWSSKDQMKNLNDWSPATGLQTVNMLLTSHDFSHSFMNISYLSSRTASAALRSIG